MIISMYWTVFFTNWASPFKVPVDFPTTGREVKSCLPQFGQWRMARGTISVTQMKSRTCDPLHVLLRHSACTSQLICWRQIADCEISPPRRSYELLSFRDSCVLPASSEDVSWVFAGTPKHGLPFSTADNDQCSKAGRDFVALPFYTLAANAAHIYLRKDRPARPPGSSNS